MEDRRSFACAHVCAIECTRRFRDTYGDRALPFHLSAHDRISPPRNVISCVRPAFAAVPRKVSRAGHDTSSHNGLDVSRKRIYTRDTSLFVAVSTFYSIKLDCGNNLGVCMCEDTSALRSYILSKYFTKIHFIVVIFYASFSDCDTSSISLKNLHHLLKGDLIFIKIPTVSNIIVDFKRKSR